MSQVNRGRFVWYDLMTSDPEAATSFYTKLIGWGTSEWEGGPEPYTMWTNRETPIGGVMHLPEDAKAAGAPPHWLAYVAVADTESTAAQAKELGGSVLHGPQTIPTVGSFAILADPQGAVFAVFTPEEVPPGHEGPPQVGEFSWHELATTDHKAALDFYSALFGWEETEATDMGEMGIYQMYGRGGSPLGGMFNKPAEMPGPPCWLFYTMVDDVHTAVEQVKELGGQVLNGPMGVPGGDWIAQCMDPQGAAFAIHSAKKG
ncbi:MAG: VOC family protein [Gemmatimonadota bacterium]|nr:MAG: VOC family protein [Gemmatimonadota bacterium]